MIVKEIAINQIDFFTNYRADHYKGLSDLMESIRSHGLLQPVGVKEKKDGRFTSIWGHSRIEAFKKLGYKFIPAIIFSSKEDEMSEEEFLILQVTENNQRKGTNLQQLGRAVKVLRKTLSYSEIAARLNLSKRKVIVAHEELQRIPVKWQKRIVEMHGAEEKEGNIPLSTAARISALRGLSQEQRDSLYKHVSKSEARQEEISELGAIMKTGRSFDEAIKLVGKYKLIDIKIFVDRKMWEEYTKTLTISHREFVVNLINSKVPNLAIASVSKNR